MTVQLIVLTLGLQLCSVFLPQFHSLLCLFHLARSKWPTSCINRKHASCRTAGPIHKWMYWGEMDRVNVLLCYSVIFLRILRIIISIQPKNRVYIIVFALFALSSHVIGLMFNSLWCDITNGVPYDVITGRVYIACARWFQVSRAQRIWSWVVAGCWSPSQVMVRDGTMWSRCLKSFI